MHLAANVLRQSVTFVRRKNVGPHSNGSISRVLSQFHKGLIILHHQLSSYMGLTLVEMGFPCRKNSGWQNLLVLSRSWG